MKQMGKHLLKTKLFLLQGKPGLMKETPVCKLGDFSLKELEILTLTNPKFKGTKKCCR
jgi:hypothetical protein